MRNVYPDSAYSQGITPSDSVKVERPPVASDVVPKPPEGVQKRKIAAVKRCTFLEESLLSLCENYQRQSCINIYWPILQCKNGFRDVLLYLKFQPKLIHLLQKRRFPIDVGS